MNKVMIAYHLKSLLRHFLHKTNSTKHASNTIQHTLQTISKNAANCEYRDVHYRPQIDLFRYFILGFRYIASHAMLSQPFSVQYAYEVNFDHYLKLPGNKTQLF